jgi:hypothetical protein
MKGELLKMKEELLKLVMQFPSITEEEAKAIADD